MLIYAKFEDDGFEYEVPLSKIIKYLDLTNEEFERAVQEAIRKM